MIAFLENYFIEEEKARLHISDLSILRGFGIFDYFRTVNQKPLFLEEHINRLFQSAKLLEIEIPFSEQEIIDIVFLLIAKNNIENSGIRITVTGGYSSDSYVIGKPNVLITQQKINTPSEIISEKGVKVITHDYVRDLPQIKSINYLMGVYLQKKVKEQNANDVLYVKNGLVTELPRANFFIVTPENKIITSTDNILYGITRKKLLEWAQQDFEIEVRNIKAAELSSCVEAFMTSTTKRILPITQINSHVIGNGEAGAITKALHQLFLQHETEIVLSSVS